MERAEGTVIPVQLREHHTMIALITGGNGQLARDIRACFEKNGVTCHACSSKELDITSYSDILQKMGKVRPDIIINCAAFTAVDLAESDWQRAYSVNGTGVRNLALAASGTSIPIVHFSTDYVFDGKKGFPYTIVDTPNPISQYGRSKLLGEFCLKDATTRFYLIRTSWVFGPGKQNFIWKLREWAANKEELAFVTDQVASPTYTADLARATWDLIQTGRYGLYHISNAGYCSRYDWASFILSELGWKGTLHTATSDAFPTPARRPLFSALDNFGTHDVLHYDLPDWQDATLRHLKNLFKMEENT